MIHGAKNMQKPTMEILTPYAFSDFPIAKLTRYRESSPDSWSESNHSSINQVSFAAEPWKNGKRLHSFPK